ncbi:MAG: asparaginase [Deltaproteobacteria bacterium]|nr:asparaginase [Deltaproteobacteria bacterium]
MMIKIFTVGGTIDKNYMAERNGLDVDKPIISEILDTANVGYEYEIEPILYKDSLEMDDADRRLVYEKIAADPNDRIVLTHGTDTMIQTAKVLKAIPNKVIVITGAMVPAVIRASDAPFNIGCAIIAVQTLSPGAYISMNGQVFNPEKTRKNHEARRVEELKAE